MELILYCCGVSLFGVLVSDVVVIVGGELLFFGVLIDWLLLRIIIGLLFLEEIVLIV